MIIHLIPLLLVSSFVIAGFGCNAGQDDYKYETNNLDSLQIEQTAASYIGGKNLFRRHCNTCHYAPEKNDADPPLFYNLFERLPAPSEDYFVKYLQDSKTLKSSGDRYAIKVDQVWNNAYEHHFKDSLSRQDFQNLITYIKIATLEKL